MGDWSVAYLLGVLTGVAAGMCLWLLEPMRRAIRDRASKRLGKVKGALVRSQSARARRRLEESWQRSRRLRVALKCVGYDMVKSVEPYYDGHRVSWVVDGHEYFCFPTEASKRAAIQKSWDYLSSDWIPGRIHVPDEGEIGPPPSVGALRAWPAPRDRAFMVRMLNDTIEHISWLGQRSIDEAKQAVAQLSSPHLSDEQSLEAASTLKALLSERDWRDCSTKIGALMTPSTRGDTPA